MVLIFLAILNFCTDQIVLRYHSGECQTQNFSSYYHVYLCFWFSSLLWKWKLEKSWNHMPLLHLYRHLKRGSSTKAKLEKLLQALLRDNWLHVVQLLWDRPSDRLHVPTFYCKARSWILEASKWRSKASNLVSAGTSIKNISILIRFLHPQPFSRSNSLKLLVSLKPLSKRLENHYHHHHHRYHHHR